jgi:phytoene synthase
VTNGPEVAASHGDAIRYAMQLFAPPHERARLAALLEIEREVAASANSRLDHAVAHARLEWWEDELRRLERGAGRHPASLRLASRARPGATPAPPPLGLLVELARADVAAVAYASDAEVAAAAEAWGASLFTAATSGVSSLPARPDAARCARAGAAIREIELIADFVPRARSGRIHAPLVGGLEDVAPWQAQPWPRHCAAALGSRLDAALGVLHACAAEFPAQERPDSLTALTWMALAADLAERCTRRLPLGLRVARGDGVRAVWVAWRAATCAARGRLPPGLR